MPVLSDIVRPYGTARFERASFDRAALLESPNLPQSFGAARVALRTLAVITAIGTVMAVVFSHQSSPSNFTLFYRDAQHIWAGSPLHIDATRNLNPPVLLWLTMPLARFPLHTAFVLWTSTSLVIAALATVQIARVVKMPALDIFVVH